jgi:hypothetical protein
MVMVEISVQQIPETVCFQGNQKWMDWIVFITAFRVSCSCLHLTLAECDKRLLQQ